MDIIAGLPNETLDGFKYTLDRVCALAPQNITVHTMCIKRTSDLNMNLSVYDLTNGAAVEDMVNHAREELCGAGFIPYYLYRQKNILGDCENVGYALPGYEGIYNIYIMEEIQTIIALGAGSVTKTVDRETNRIERIFNVKEAVDYIARIDEMIARKAVIAGMTRNPLDKRC